MAPLNLTAFYIPALMSTLLRSKVDIIKEAILLLEIYDYIIVGSGPGGSLVANRLSQDPSINVLLLEAGGKDNVTTEIPITTYVMIKDGYDWMYDTTPQERACLGMVNKKCSVSTGKVIGGSSALDFTIYNRGHKLDYDDWGKLGNSGWSYDDVLPFYKKFEDFRINGDCVKDDVHGCEGELFINGSATVNEFTEATKCFLKGAKELGYNETNFFSEKQIGFNYGHYRIKNGVRLSAATAFLRPIQKQPNLHIVLNAFVHKILIDPETKTVTGVEYEKDGKVQQVKVKKEVILSAGTYSSPKILKLSGIGPKEELEKFEIPVIIDLPGVGQNLQELVGGQIPVTTGRILTDEEQNLISTLTIRKWRKGIGLMTSPSTFDAYAFVKSKYAESDAPDLMLLFQSMNFNAVISPFIKKSLSVTDEFFGSWFDGFIDREFANVQPFLLHPKSKGSVKLRSSDVHDLPFIDPNYFSEEIDQKVLVEGFRIAENLVKTTSFQKRGFKTRSTKLKVCDEFDSDSDEYITCLFKHFTVPKWSGCCTNKMGPETDNFAVVDSRLRVRGISRLRVVDASVFPQQVSGLPGATVFMVGEKAAAMIKEDNN